MKNVIQTQLSAEDKIQIDTLINQLENLLQGKLSAMTENERLVYGSVNEQNKLLINKVHDYQQQHPTMSAPEVDWEEFETDYQSRTFLETRLTTLRSIAYRMESTKILHDYDNYQDALIDYGYAQYKKGAGESGYTEKVAELKQFFPRTITPQSNTPSADNTGV